MKYPYLVIALLLIFGVVDIAILGNSFGLTKSEWSGWVQAIGAIAAIGVGWTLAQHQIRHAEKSRNAEFAKGEKVHMAIGLRLAKDVYGIHMDVHRKFTMNQTHYAGKMKQLRTVRIEEMQTSLHNFTLRPIDPLLYAEIQALIRELANTLTAVQEQNAMANTSNQRIKRALRRATAVLKCRDRIQARLTLM